MRKREGIPPKPDIARLLAKWRNRAAVFGNTPHYSACARQANRVPVRLEFYIATYPQTHTL